MRIRTFTTEAIIINRYNFAEADRLLTIFSKDYGKIRCIAKGVRRPTSRKSGHVELFDRTKLYIARGKNIDIITQAQVLERFTTLHTSLKAAKAAFHIIELINLLFAEKQESPGIFEDVIETLRVIDSQQHATSGQIAKLEEKILAELGFGTPQQASKETLHQHIEEIVEQKLKTVEIFKDI